MSQLDQPMERWLSGLKRLPAKQEPGKPGTRVRIPLSPVISQSQPESTVRECDMLAQESIITSMK